MADNFKSLSVCLSMVAHSYNASIWEAKARDLEFKPSLGYTMRHCIKKKKS